MAPLLMNDFVAQFLIWATATLVGVLIAILGWLALGVFRKLDQADARRESLVGIFNDQFAAFGKQLTAVKDLVMEDIHKHDVRITRLEEWRRHQDRQRGDPGE